MEEGNVVTGEALVMERRRLDGALFDKCMPREIPDTMQFAVQHSAEDQLYGFLVIVQIRQKRPYTCAEIVESNINQQRPLRSLGF